MTGSTGNVALITGARQAIAEAFDRFGWFDILVNIAGTVQPIGPIEGIDPADWAHGIAVNLVGIYQRIRAVFGHFREQSGAASLHGDAETNAERED